MSIYNQTYRHPKMSSGVAFTCYLVFIALVANASVFAGQFSFTVYSAEDGCTGETLTVSESFTESQCINNKPSKSWVATCDNNKLGVLLYNNSACGAANLYLNLTFLANGQCQSTTVNGETGFVSGTCASPASTHSNWFNLLVEYLNF